MSPAGDDDEEAKRRGAVVRSARTLRSAVWRILPCLILFLELLLVKDGGKGGDARGRRRVVVVRGGVDDETGEISGGNGIRGLPSLIPTDLPPVYPRKITEGKRDNLRLGHHTSSTSSLPPTREFFVPRT